MQKLLPIKIILLLLFVWVNEGVANVYVSSLGLQSSTQKISTTLNNNFFAEQLQAINKPISEGNKPSRVYTAKRVQSSRNKSTYNNWLQHPSINVSSTHTNQPQLKHSCFLYNISRKNNNHQLFYIALYSLF